MRIEKIYVAGFGGLKDYTLELNSGLNVIYGENENGKTTVMNFIRAMFYGTGNKVKDLSKSIREKYRPWDGGIMAGRIYFEDSGRRYCLEREFKKTDSTDKITLSDADTGEIIPTDSEIGPKFFGIGVESFERSMFIGNIGAQVARGDESGEINAKLSSLATTGEEDTSYGFVENNLQNARKKFVAKGKNAGTYTKDTEKLSELKQNLATSKVMAEKYDTLCCELEALKTQLKDNSDIIKSKKALLDSKDDTKNAQKLEEYIKLCEDYETLTENLKFKDGALVTIEFLNALKLGISKVEKCNQRIKDLSEDAERIKAKIELSDESNTENSKLQFESTKLGITETNDEIKSLEEEQKAADTKLSELDEAICKAKDAKKAFNPILLIIGAAAAVISIVALFTPLHKAAAIAFIGIGAVLTVLSFILRPRDLKLVSKLENDKLIASNESSALKSRISVAQSKLFALNTKFEMLQSAVNADTSAKAQMLEELKVKDGQLLSEAQKRENELKNLAEYYSKYGDETDFDAIVSKLSSLSGLLESAKPTKSRMIYLSEDLGGIDKSAACEKLASMQCEDIGVTVDFEALKLEYEQLLQKQSTVIARISEKNTELKTGFKGYENPESIAREITLLSEKIESEKQYLAAIDTATEVLSDSFAQLRRSYGSVLDKKALEIFSRLTDGRYGRMEISKGLEIKVEQANTFGTKEVEYLSSGTIDQAYFSLKLAVSALISDKKGLPVLLDDSLSQYDDVRMKRAVEFLKEYSENSQIIFFTCHSNVTDAAENSGAKIISVKK